MMLKIFSNFRHTDDFVFLNQFETKPITFFYDYVPKNNELTFNPINIIMVHEPDEFFGIHSWVKANHDIYSVILTWNKDILDRCSNSYPFICNYHQDSIEYYNQFKTKEKKFEISFLSGTKTLSEGHKLRQEIFKMGNQINIPKKWFHVLEDFDIKNNVRPGYNEYSKDLSHIPLFLQKNPQVFGKRVCYDEPMFHVCVENVKYDNWYTEKIGEAFCTKTVPIYWGCPNIGEKYDKNGIITFDSVEELMYIINSLTPEKYYQMKQAIDYNYEIALKDSFSNNLTKIFNQLIELNNL